MNFWELIGLIALVVWGIMTILWIVSLALKDAGIVDIFWGLGFVIINWVAFLVTENESGMRQWLLNVIVTIWGMRLFLHILIRNIGKPEDFRYQNFRKQYGKKFWWYSYFQTFMLQGFLMFIISMPLVITQYANTPESLGFLDWAGLLLWLVGFFFETAGDYQLTRFKKNPANKGKIMKSGVWKYTRHPNYFGDATQWWAYYLIAVSVPFGFLTIFSPIIMSYFLVKVSGVAMLERSMAEKKPGYKEYMQTTNAFIPWFPREINPKEDK